MFRKIYIYSNTHPRTRCQVYPPSNKSHMSAPFFRVGYQVPETPKSHAANTFYALLLMVWTRSSESFRLKPGNSNSHGFELHRPSIKGTRLMLVKKAIIIIRSYWRDSILFQKLALYVSKFSAAAGLPIW